MDDPQLEDLSPDGDGPGSERCLICLNTFSGQPVATPQQCDHHYCLTCITDWAKTANSCPVDRLEFQVVYQRSRVGGDISETVEVELRQSSASEEEAADVLSVCEECGRSDHRLRMLLCSGCDTRFHIDCLTPPLSSVPIGDWFCQDCPAERRHIEDSDIDEDEISDLLSDTVSTSCRLRPSTTQLPPVPSRRSQRVPPQSSPWVLPRSSPTLQHVPRYLLKSSRPADEENTNTGVHLLNTAESNQPITHKKRRR